MERQIRIRNKTLDVQTTLWKLLPMFFLILLYLVSTTISGGTPSGANIPVFE
ncbi:MAG: hypothetical protein ACFE95_22395 [Candidatus Hodarchaeota archaeon]